MKGQTLLIRGGKHQWEQIILPDGRNVLKRETLGEEEMAQSKLRLHITDALLCQFNHGGQSRPDFATALNELWFSRDPVTLDTLSHELITKLRKLMNLPARTNPRKLLRYASGKKLGTDSVESMKIKKINLLVHARINRESKTVLRFRQYYVPLQIRVIEFVVFRQQKADAIGPSPFL